MLSIGMRASKIAHLNKPHPLPDDCRKRFPFGGFAVSVNGDVARRDMLAGHIEPCLVSGMAIGERCSRNKASPCR